MVVVTSASFPKETYPDARAFYTDDSFLTGGSTDKSAVENCEVENHLRADALMHVEGQSFDAQNSQLHASDVSWARQDVNMPMVSMQDYVLLGMGDSDHWEGQQYQLPQHRQCGNVVAPLTVSAASNPQTIKKHSTMGSSLHHIVPSNIYGLPGGHTATPRQTPGNSCPWQHTTTNSKGASAVTGEDVKTKIIASSSPSLSKKNHIYQSATKPERVKTDERATNNDIERKYRTNLKSRFAELRAAIPALKEKQDGRSDGNTNHATLKVSKGTILSKATKYIKQLEKANWAMASEHQQLTEKLHALETQLQREKATSSTSV
ncbi:hypothetical protein K4F52_010155 [Lecanicillium sp. MT-2017a]|nr:hypothetical protein K4F52_010155 [Lecanicillium sp. MT-2017a]